MRMTNHLPLIWIWGHRPTWQLWQSQLPRSIHGSNILVSRYRWTNAEFAAGLAVSLRNGAFMVEDDGIRHQCGIYYLKERPAWGIQKRWCFTTYRLTTKRGQREPTRTVYLEQSCESQLWIRKETPFHTLSGCMTSSGSLDLIFHPFLFEVWSICFFSHGDNQSLVCRPFPLAQSPCMPHTH